jgi:hypothetical protein
MDASPQNKACASSLGIAHPTTSAAELPILDVCTKNRLRLR